MNRVDFMSPWDRTNLCRYVRGLVGTLIFLAYLVSAPLLLAWGLHAWFSVEIVKNSLLDLVVTCTVGGGAVGIFIDSIIILLWLREKGYLPEFELKWERTPKKEPNLIIEWLKAKKKKICPTIQFLD